MSKTPAAQQLHRRHEGRYTFGKRGADGRTPVFVDGASDPSGYVWNTGHGAERWFAEGSATVDATYPIPAARRWQAAEQIVALIDARADAAREVERKRAAAATSVPKGWRPASWGEITREGFRRVRLVTEAPYVDPATDPREPDAGERYAAAWTEPVRLRAVSRHGRAHKADHDRYGDFLSISRVGATMPHHVDGNHAIALGALVPADSPRRTGSAAACPSCGADALLYASGGRTECGPCTAHTLGWDVEDLPHPDHFDNAPAFQPGEPVAMDVAGTDGIVDTYTGTVHEWQVRLDGTSKAVRSQQSRNVRVDFRPYGSGQFNCDPATLRRVETVAELPAGSIGGWRAGMPAVLFRYNADGVAFERHGYVVGLSADSSNGGHRVRFTTSPTVPAEPRDPGEVFRPGSYEAWCASHRRSADFRCSDRAWVGEVYVTGEGRAFVRLICESGRDHWQHAELPGSPVQSVDGIDRAVATAVLWDAGYMHQRRRPWQVVARDGARVLRVSLVPLLPEEAAAGRPGTATPRPAPNGI
ncbi:hypothetical protein GCM10012285_60240 [Streptomyces kronopolitis]|uniref:DNA primase n=1 Tax=Streptomyces kronopolitis TaxID=1612435 RepID=A0ABQ2K1Q8_9ACTN|nr:hypothetical protein [Streptomyces kronopolitis]GGN61396.1 hypothetical protein GCM10012285_60240 [Streptomyces kronopolitis]